MDFAVRHFVFKIIYFSSSCLMMYISIQCGHIMCKNDWHRWHQYVVPNGWLYRCLYEIKWLDMKFWWHECWLVFYDFSQTHGSYQGLDWRFHPENPQQALKVIRAVFHHFFGVQLSSCSDENKIKHFSLLYHLLSIVQVWNKKILPAAPFSSQIFLYNNRKNVYLTTVQDFFQVCLLFHQYKLK